MRKSVLVNLIFFVLIFGLMFFSVIEVDTNPDKKVKSATANIMYEKDYVNQYCDGQREYVLPDKTRIDCLTDEYAIEFDYAKKWAESIGQSLYYAKKTGKKPAVAIILKQASDKKYIQRINDVDKDIKVFEIYAVDYE